MDDDMKTKDSFSFDEEEEIEELSLPPQRSRLVFKIITAFLLLAFVAFSYPNISSLWSGELGFLKQNRSLTGDEIVQKCKPAIVSIQAVDSSGVTRFIVKGTGFNLASNGLIITNRHVVKGSSQVQITFSDGSSYFSRNIKTMDNYDIAVIKLNSRKLPFLRACTDQPVQTGQTVTVIGNPLGFERISARGPVGNFHNGGDAGAVIFDMAITVKPGSSGSPVLNKKGQVVGIVFGTGTITGQRGTRALAIPITQIKNIFK